MGRYRVKRCSKCALCKIKSNSVEQREERKRERERERERSSIDQKKVIEVNTTPCRVIPPQGARRGRPLPYCGERSWEQRRRVQATPAGICLEWEIMVGSKGQEAVECTECRWLGAVIEKMLIRAL